jgi:predicted house-cleaning noncanonical NTP pyrophosphatase (MazG superfamily)
VSEIVEFCSKNKFEKLVWEIVEFCSKNKFEKLVSEIVEFCSKSKFEKLVHLVSFIIRIYHDARPSECQKITQLFYLIR